MKNKRTVYILYTYNNFTNDYSQVMEYYNLKDLQEKNDIKLENKKSIYNYIYKSIDQAFEINNKLFNKYVIIKEVLQ